MSSREKNLLYLFLIVIVLGGGLIAHRQFYVPRYDAAKKKLDDAQLKISTAEAIGENKELFKDQIDWILRNEPKPVSRQVVQSNLQNACDTEALKNELEVKKQNFLPPPEITGAHYDRARIDLILVGNERNFYNWVASIDNPLLFQRITSLELYPNKADDTLIEARVVVEKWFTPAVN